MRRAFQSWSVQFAVLVMGLSLALWAWAEFTLTPTDAPTTPIIIAAR